MYINIPKAFERKVITGFSIFAYAALLVLLLNWIDFCISVISSFLTTSKDLFAFCSINSLVKGYKLRALANP